jgi:hypothetical protein
MTPLFREAWSQAFARRGALTGSYRTSQRMKVGRSGR